MMYNIDKDIVDLVVSQLRGYIDRHEEWKRFATKNSNWDKQVDAKDIKLARRGIRILTKKPTGKRK